MKLREFVGILIIILLSPQTAHADWRKDFEESWAKYKETAAGYYDRAESGVKDGFNATMDATRNFTGSLTDGITASPAEKDETVPRYRALQIWDESLELFDEISILKSKREKAPESSLFGSTKQDYDEKLEMIFADLAQLMNDPEIQGDREKLAALDGKISNSKEHATDLSAKAALAAGSKRAELEKTAAVHRDEARDYEKSRRNLLIKVRNRLTGYGLSLSTDQVEVLLSRVDAGDILEMTSVFSIVSEMTRQFSEAMAASGENLEIARKYYGIHVSLLELQMYIQETYMEKLRSVYIVNIQRIKSQNSELIGRTSDLMNDASGTRRKIYEFNLRAQQQTQRVASLYERILATDLQKIESVHEKIGESYEVARNTLETVSVSSDLALLMAENRNLFSEVMMLQTPELIPFENLQMQKEFEELSAQIADM